MNLDHEILSAEDEFKKASARLAQLRATKTERDSKAFILANEITKDQVEFPDGDGKPFFGHVWAFANWIRKNSTKRWAVWNGIIFHAVDLLNGRFTATPGRTEHL